LFTLAARRDIFYEAGRQLLQHALLCHCAGDLLAFQFQVMMEARHELVVIDCEPFEAVVQVEHVAILAALQKRAQLGSEQFFGP